MCTLLVSIGIEVYNYRSFELIRIVKSQVNGTHFFCHCMRLFAAIKNLQAFNRLSLKLYCAFSVKKTAVNLFIHINNTLSYAIHYA